MAGVSREVATTSVICGGSGNGAQLPTFILSPLAHFFHIARSASILMKMPPTTGRACMPPLRTLSVSYESASGSRALVAFK